jgi:HAD superfamily hydrolase (TIGR01484 family)
MTKGHIKRALHETLDDLNVEFPHRFGAQIEDRESQITFSALGQQAPIHLKKEWDPDQKKRKTIIAGLQAKIPQYEIRYGGTTSIDITRKGIDKSYGMKRLMEQLNLEKSDILFIGDALQPGGNDYAVKAMGIDCIEVDGPAQTLKEIEKILS